MSYATADELDRFAAELLAMVPRIRATAKAMRRANPPARVVTKAPKRVAKKKAAKKPMRQAKKPARKTARKVKRAARSR